MADATADDTVVFELKVRCRKNPLAGKEVVDPDEKYIDSKGTIYQHAYYWCVMRRFYPCIHTISYFSFLF